MCLKRQIRWIFSIACIVSLLFSGCSDSNVEGKNPLKSDGKPIIEYKDNTVYSHQVLLKMNFYLSKYNMSIKDLSEDKEIWERFKNDIVFELSANSIALEKAEELGFDKITSEEQKSLDEELANAMENAEKQVRDGMAQLDLSDDEFEKEYNIRLNDYFFKKGYDLDTYDQTLRNEYIIDKTKKHFTRDITVTEAEVLQEYEKSLAMQKDSIEKQPSFIEQQLLMGGEVLYYPKGYMYAKHIMISFDSKTRGAAAIAYENKDLEAYNKLVEEGYRQIKPRVDQIIQELNAGADFDKLIEQQSDDKFFSEEPYKSEGIMIGPYSASFGVPEYLEALNTIEEEGSFSQPVKTFMGCFIIKSEKMLAGEVPFEDVKSSMTEALLEQRRSFQWSSINQQWIDEAKDNRTLTIYPERIDDDVLSDN